MDYKYLICVSILCFPILGKDYEATIIKAAHKNSVPGKVLVAICKVESRLKADAVHRNDGNHNSVGLCQVQLRTAKWLGFQGNEKDLYRPEINAAYAAKYLAYQMKRYDGNLQHTIVAYNRGSLKLVNRIPSNIHYYHKVVAAMQR